MSIAYRFGGRKWLGSKTNRQNRIILTETRKGLRDELNAAKPKGKRQDTGNSSLKNPLLLTPKHQLLILCETEFVADALQAFFDGAQAAVEVSGNIFLMVALGKQADDADIEIGKLERVGLLYCLV